MESSMNPSNAELEFRESRVADRPEPGSIHPTIDVPALDGVRGGAVPLALSLDDLGSECGGAEHLFAVRGLLLGVALGAVTWMVMLIAAFTLFS